MDLISKGFDVETEITIKAARMELKTTDIPIAYGERAGETKLHPIKDGYRILRAIMSAMPVYNPTAFFSLPGLLMLLSGLFLTGALLWGNLRIGGINLSIHASVLASMLAISGFQVMIFGVTSRMYAVRHKFIKPSILTRFFARRSVQLGMKILGAMLFAGGLLTGWREPLLPPPSPALVGLASRVGACR